MNTTLNGRGVLGARVNLGRNGTPSRASVMLCERPDDDAAVLRIGEREFTQFRVREVLDLGGRWRVELADVREDWRALRVTLDVGGDLEAALTAILTGVGVATNVQVDVSRVVPARRFENASLLDALTQVALRAGCAWTINDSGEVETREFNAADKPDPRCVIEQELASESSVRVTSANPMQETVVDDFTAVIPDATAGWVALSEVLDEHGIRENDARRACLSEGGFHALLPKTADADLVARLTRYAYRAFRFEDAILAFAFDGESQTLTAPRVTARSVRSTGVAPDNRRASHELDVSTHPLDAFELDTQARVLVLERPCFALDDRDPDDPTLQNRRLLRDPEIELHALTHSNAPAVEVTLGDNTAHVTHHAAPWIVPVLDTDGNALNADGVRRELALLAESAHTSQFTLAGVAEQMAAGSCRRVTINSDQTGVTSRVEYAPVTAPPEANTSATRTGNATRPTPSGLHQPINAWRSGPLVIRASGDVPETESDLAVEAVSRDPKTAALTLRNLGPLAHPFFVPSNDPQLSGRWYFVAGARDAGGSQARLLSGDQDDPRHDSINAPDLFPMRLQRAEGQRGLVVDSGDGACFVDVGPLISDARGSDRARASSLIYDLDASGLSPNRRGGLQKLTLLAYTRDGWQPVLNFRNQRTGHSEYQGRGAFAEADGRDIGRLSATDQHGPLFADAGSCDKHRLGSHAGDDGVYRECAGHLSTEAFFKVPGDAHHDAPLKFVRAPFEGAPARWRPFEALIKFDAASPHSFDGGTRSGLWRIEYRLPFFPDIPPTWRPPVKEPPVPPTPPDDPPPLPPPNPTLPPEAIPPVNPPSPTLPPEAIPPVTSDREVWAPSHDWIPAPSTNRDRDVRFTGPSLRSEGWANESSGEPDARAGGGVVFLPPNKCLVQSDVDDDVRDAFVLLHPEVELAFGHPSFDHGAPRDGWRLGEWHGDLRLRAVDADADEVADLSCVFCVESAMKLGRLDATFDGAKALRLGEAEDDGIAFGDDVALFRSDDGVLRVDGAMHFDDADETARALIDDATAATSAKAADELLLRDDANDAGRKIAVGDLFAAGRVVTLAYTGNATSGLTVTLTGVRRAHWIRVIRSDGSGTVLPLDSGPLGTTGTINWRRADGVAGSSWSLDAPSSGDQTLTINDTNAEDNADGVTYALHVTGEPS